MTYASALITLLAIGISGCASPPLVDLTGVNMGAYSRDQIACDAELKQTTFYAGDFIADCLARKGYKVAKTGR
ncbi:hypothetical protein [Methylobacterium sp. Leaf108]|uniref:hypothetical protein n=1 Tax=Methylobacterium sp. Leaf108 TaxID=1736256 RepID=UPI00070051A0|nr:hypothetical protein [Methylobacterium sp. Leaf108]KQP55053.1 hypothetical protein ASF39_04780 [Methylobacterium sp. Leaf108]